MSLTTGSFTQTLVLQISPNWCTAFPRLNVQKVLIGNTGKQKFKGVNDRLLTCELSEICQRGQQNQSRTYAHACTHTHRENRAKNGIQNLLLEHVHTNHGNVRLALLNVCTPV
ncbi:hypothetical protein GOP47_0021316 [Adiantum capillus-veneris]|uniref:Uncharacterized protein n=1 Tax=Adiantum capillus-veneris TaxID=13818 RepID=A0A9D4Z9J2_ADICA|nr:hypothetical protein GOP47_0021316 [Adiantum capillus-veneris]